MTTIGGRFVLRGEAAAGGMGAVHRAIDRLTGDAVAVKLLREVGERQAARFAREAQVLADLDHPGIVRYVAHGVTEVGHPYLVMEWLEGESLEARLACGRGPAVRETLAVVRAAADALGFAHARGVVHRDVKPSNLFLLPRPDGATQVKLLDFGIAWWAGGNPRLTRTGALVGTPAYMSPEQARRETRTDARADIFALGAVLFECLAGRPAFEGDSPVAVLAKILLQDAPRLSDLRADLPPALDDLVARMLAKVPSSRPPDGGAVTRALDAIEASGALGEPEAIFPRRARGTASLGNDEQRVVTVAVARTGPDLTALEAPGGAAPSPASAAASPADLGATIECHGARLEVLADGRLVVLLSGRGHLRDQAVRAARCALSLRARLPGIAMVLATGPRSTRPSLPGGEVIDGALAALARVPPGTIALDEPSAELLEGRFDVSGTDGRSLGEERVLLDVGQTAGGGTACVGRERELAVLDTIFRDSAASASPRAVLVSAPAGLGKSRLRREFLRRLHHAGTPVELMVARGDPDSAASTFGMLARALLDAAGIEAGDSPAGRREKLRARVARSVAEADQARVTHFLGELSGVPFPDEESPLFDTARADARLASEQTCAAWMDFLAAECAARPVLLVLEDLHWGDLPSVQLVDAALARIEDRPLMVLALARPEVHERFPRLWPDRDVTEMKLGRLSRRACEELAGDEQWREIPPQERAWLLDQGGGHPRHVEELLRAAVHRASAPPPSLLGILQARLDELDPETRRVLRAASVFGDVFWSGGVAALVGVRRGAVEVDTPLGELLARDLVVPRPAAAFSRETEWAFRHGLVRQAAYATLTAEDRVLGHRLAGDWLERMGERDAAVLADHLEHGHEQARAAALHGRAAAVARDAGDFQGAIVLAERGIACRATGGVLGALRVVQAEAYRWKGALGDAARCARAAAAALPRGSAAWFQAMAEALDAAGPAAGQAGDAATLERLARDLRAAGPLDAAAQLGRVVALSAAASALVAAGLGAGAATLLELAEEAEGDAGGRDPLGRARIHGARARWFVHEGCFGAAVGEHRAAAARADEAGDARGACLERTALGHLLVQVGHPRRAEPLLRECLAAAVRLGLDRLAGDAESSLALALCRLGALAEARDRAERAVARLARTDDPRTHARARLHLAEVLTVAGDAEGAEAEAEQAASLCGRNGALRIRALALRSRAAGDQGRRAEALHHAEDALALVEALEDGVPEGESLARLAHVEALLARGERCAADQAVRLARARLLSRAGLLGEGPWRESYLSVVPENALVLALAAALEAEVAVPAA